MRVAAREHTPYSAAASRAVQLPPAESHHPPSLASQTPRAHRRRRSRVLVVQAKRKERTTPGSFAREMYGQGVNYGEWEPLTKKEEQMYRMFGALIGEPRHETEDKLNKRRSIAGVAEPEWDEEEFTVQELLDELTRYLGTREPGGQSVTKRSPDNLSLEAYSSRSSGPELASLSEERRAELERLKQRDALYNRAYDEPVGKVGEKQNERPGTTFDPLSEERERLRKLDELHSQLFAGEAPASMRRGEVKLGQQQGSTIDVEKQKERQRYADAERILDQLASMDQVPEQGIRSARIIRRSTVARKDSSPEAGSSGVRGDADSNFTGRWRNSYDEFLNNPKWEDLYEGSVCRVTITGASRAGVFVEAILGNERLHFYIPPNEAPEMGRPGGKGIFAGQQVDAVVLARGDCRDDLRLSLLTEDA